MHAQVNMAGQEVTQNGSVKFSRVVREGITCHDDAGDNRCQLS